MGWRVYFIPRNPLPTGEGRVRVRAEHPAVRVTRAGAALTLTLSRGERGRSCAIRGMPASHLLHIPPWDDLGHRQDSLDVDALGSGLDPLAVIELRHEFPGIVLELAGDRFALLERRRLRPFVAQLFLFGVGGPAEPRLVAGRRMGGEEDRIADRRAARR